MDLSQLDDDAVRATQRLIKQGFEAYLVGGCVRDLLLGREPKDYDIATEARPQQVKRVFPRNCRIIGRRFKLAHLHFHGNTKILECSTFRRTPQQGENGDDVLITRDNEFGTAEEDALRRDFTVNALFLDPTRDTILDYTDGLRDLHARVIRTIGDPRVRFREDPVRILRAAKFAGRLGFTVEPETFAAMCETSGDLVRSAPPRLFEEILRLLRSGHALDSFQLLRDVGALKSLVPLLADFVADAEHEQRVEFWRTLEALDQHVRDGHRPQNGVLLGALLVGPVLAKVARNPGRSPTAIAEELLSPFCAALRLPRRDAGCVKRICGVQHRFAQNDHEKRFRTEGFVHGPYFLEALELFELRTHARGDDLAVVDRWKDLASEVFGEGGPAPRPADEDLVDAAPADDEAAERGDGAFADEPAAETEHGADGSAEPATDEDSEEQPAGAVARGEGEPTGNPWEQPNEPGRRRRRRRRRRRGGRRDDEAQAPAHAAVRADGSDAASGDLAPPFDDGDAADAPRSVRTPHVAPDFVHPEGAEDESDVDVGIDSEALDARREQIADRVRGDDEPLARQADDAAGPTAGDDEGPGRRRRRRRRRRGRRGGGGGERFPPSDRPAPHGEAVDAEHRAHEPLHDDDVTPDPDAPPRTDVDAGDGELRTADAGEAVEGSAAERGADEQPRRDEQAAPGDDERRGRRRRRRRGGRGRGRPDEHGGERGELRPQPPGPQPGQRHGQQQHHGQRRDERQKQHDQKQHGRRDRHRGRGGPRDVDVVPRHRDRRGQVDVIEPAALDLSAFDVELDPKRVPTFGSIVEGKGRPKRRGPRVPDDGVDDYKPPPPPGGDAPPPPPPPTHDAPDTFGDW